MTAADEEAARLVRLGDQLADAEDDEGAAEAYRRAMAVGSTASWGKAAFLLADQIRYVDEAESQRIFEAVIQSEDRYSPAAAVELGDMLKDRGDTQGAKDLFVFAIKSNDADQAPMAAFLLGRLLELEGDNNGAISAYEFALKTKHPDEAPLAGAFLATLLYSIGEKERGEAVNRFIIEHQLY